MALVEKRAESPNVAWSLTWSSKSRAVVLPAQLCCGFSSLPRTKADRWRFSTEGAEIVPRLVDPAAGWCWICVGCLQII